MHTLEKKKKTKNNLNSHRKTQKRTKEPKESIRKDVIITAEISEIKSRKIIKEINEIKSWFFENIDKISKPLTDKADNNGRRQKSPTSGIKQEISLNILQVSKE